MKRYLFTLVFILTLAAYAQAGQFGSRAANVGEKGLSVSAGLDYTNRDMNFNGTKKEMSTRKLVATGDYGLTQDLDIFLKLGLADMEISNFKGRLEGLYGAGVKFKLFKDPEDRVNVTINGGITRFTSSDSTSEATVTDYMGAFIVSNKLGNINPYAGLKISESELEFKSSGSSSKYTADKKIGLLVGVDYFVNPNVFFNGEVNLFDQQSIYAGAGFKF